MKFYGLGDVQVLEMPIKRFWLLHKNIDRMTAEEDLRTMQIGISVQSAEGYKSANAALEKQLGKIVVYDEAKRALHVKRDSAGLKRLQNMGSVGRR